jgi:hypothetical protein
VAGVNCEIGEAKSTADQRKINIRTAANMRAIYVSVMKMLPIMALLYS